MSNDNKGTPDFFHPAAYSLRAIDPEWVDKRSKEIAVATGSATPEDCIQEALEEVLTQLAERTGHNFDDQGEPFVYTPDVPGQPYVMLVPLKVLTSSKRPKADIPQPKHAPNPNNKRSNLRLDFEATVFEIEPGLNKSDLAKDGQGRYYNARMQALWDGFQMYHNRFTTVKSPTFRVNYQKALGRYVIAKIGPNGVPLFNRAPFRHMTIVDATTEALRLADEHQDGFAIFRCMDIVGKPKEETT